MDYQKVDAALAAALDEIRDPEQRALSVFIHTSYTPEGDAADFLEDLGVRDVGGGRQVFTATLSPRAVSDLSDQPWLEYMRLSRRLRLVGNG